MSGGRWLALAVALWLAVGEAAQAADEWLSPRPLGSGALVVDPGDAAVIYAGAGTGRLSVSRDGGRRWALAALGAEWTVRNVIIDPRDPQIFYTFHDGQVRRSLDRGATWLPPGVGLDDLIPRVLAFDPTAPEVLYLGAAQGPTDDAVVAKSTDGGASWSSVTVVPIGGGVTALAIDPFAPATLYAGTDWSGVYRSDDAGATWAPAHAGLAGTGSGGITALVAIPASPGCGTPAPRSAAYTVRSTAAAPGSAPGSTSTACGA